MIELRSVTKTYGGAACIHKLSLTLEPGGLYCVTGPSGSGKTTLLRLIMGLEKPDSGEIITNGADFGVMFQEDRLLEGFDAADNLRLALGIKSRPAARRELPELLEEDALDKPVGKLSGGQRRRIALVRAMVLRRSCYLLDEPFAGLDAESAARALEYIRRMARGSAVLMALHEKDIPADVGRVIRLNNQ